MNKSIIVPFTGLYTKEQAEERHERLRRAALVFRRRYWNVAYEFYEFYRGQAFRHFGYSSMSAYLEDGNGVVGRSWGMLLIAMHYNYKVALPAVMDDEQADALEFMLQNIKAENLQIIQPQVNRLLARASGHPLPSDPKGAEPITMVEAVDSVLELVTVAHQATNESDTRRAVREMDEGKPLKIGFQFRTGELPVEVRKWWASLGVPIDKPTLKFYGVANEDRNEFSGQ